MGRVGFGGGSIHADEALRNSDFLLRLGCQLTDVSTYGYNWMPSGKVAAVTLDTEAGKKLNYALVSYSDAVDFLRKLLDKVEGYRTPESWLKEIEGWRKSWEQMVMNAVNMEYKGFCESGKVFQEAE